MCLFILGNLKYGAIMLRNMRFSADLKQGPRPILFQVPGVCDQFQGIALKYESTWYELLGGFND